MTRIGQNESDLVKNSAFSFKITGNSVNCSQSGLVFPLKTREQSTELTTTFTSETLFAFLQNVPPVPLSASPCSPGVDSLANDVLTAIAAVKKQGLDVQRDD
jgi:hypothetical protein